MEHGGLWPVSRQAQVALAVVAGLALLVVGRVMVRRPAEGIPLVITSPTPQEVFVHVAGEVLVPGVYRLRAGARWADAVQAARGATYLADLDAVNLAQPLRDGDRVYVPRVPDPVFVGAGPEGEGASGAPARRDATGPARRNPTGASAPPAAPGVSAPLDVNAASVADLEALPGIGPVLAGRIVEYRQMHGRFQRVEDLLEVKGIGPRLLERLRPLVWVR